MEELSLYATNRELLSDVPDVATHLRKLFPDPQSLENIDDIDREIANLLLASDNLVKLTLHIPHQDAHDVSLGFETLISNAKDATESVEDLATDTKEAFSNLEEATKDVRALNRAKANLLNTFSLLRKIDQYTKYLEEMRLAVINRQCDEAAILYSTLDEISTSLKEFHHHAKVSNLEKKFNLLTNDMLKYVLSYCEAAFADHFQFNRESRDLRPSMSTRIDDVRMQSICVFVDALGVGAKQKILNLYVDILFKDYYHLFNDDDTDDDSKDIGATTRQFESLPRRYHWLSKVVRNYHSILPEKWFPLSFIVHHFVLIIRRLLEKYISPINKPPSSVQSLVDVKMLLHVFQLTIDFEASLEERFGADMEVPFSSSLSHSNILSLKGILTSCFEPAFVLYVDAEDRQLNSFFERIKGSPRKLEASHIFSSALDVILAFKQALDRCDRLNSQRAFSGLLTILEKYLLCYIDFLESMLPKDFGDHITGMDKLMTCVYILNTAEYFIQALPSLEKKSTEDIQRKDKQHYPRASLSTLNHALLAVIDRVLVELVKGTEKVYCENSFALFLKKDWNKLDAIRDYSDFINILCQSLRKVCNTNFANTFQNPDYYKVYFERLSVYVAQRLIANIQKLKSMSEIGAEQLLLDIQAYKNAMLAIYRSSLKVTSANAIDWQHYTSKLNMLLYHQERELKFMMSSISSPESAVELFVSLFPEEKTFNGLQRLLHIRNIQKADQAAMSELFLKKIQKAHNTVQ